MPLRPIHLPLLLALIALLGATAPDTQPTTRSSLADDKLKAKALIDRDMQDLTSLGEHDLSEIIRFDVKDDRLVPMCDLHVADNDFHEVHVRGLGGRAKFRVVTSHSDPAGHQSPQFYYYDLDSPGSIVVYTEVDSTLYTMGLAQFSESEDRLLSVQYGETADVGPQAVNLYIQIVPETDAGAETREHLTGASLADLCMNHPSEVNTYLRPIFRMLGQEQTVFQVDPKTAYQVFSPAWKTDAATIAATDAAVAGLRADSYSDREAAMNRLRRLGEPAALYLMNVDSRSWSIEQAMRVDLFLAPYLPLNDQTAAQLRTDPDFLLDCQFSPQEQIRRLALDQLRDVTGKSIDLNPDLSGRALVDAVTKLRLAISPAATQP
jgi:hypothetical protein